MSRASRRAVAVLAAAFALLLLLPSPAAAFFNASLDIVIVVDKPSYRAGDTVNATVYVIWGGTLSDVGFVDLQFQVTDLTPWTQSVPLTRESAGVFTGSFLILANMTASGVPWLGLRSDASVGPLTGSGFVLVYLTRPPVLTDHAFLSTYEAAPGQTVNGTVETYLDGVLADVDNLTILASLFISGFPYTGSQLAVRNVSAGTYGFSYTVPSNVNLSGSVFFFGNAEVAAVRTSFGLSNLPSLRIDVADPFLIWTHQVALIPGRAAFDVWVADPSGIPLAGVGVWVAGDTLLHYPNVLSGHALTDAAGRASFDFRFASTVSLQYSYFYGYVTRGSANESFTTYLAASGVATPSLVIERDNPQDLFEPGERAVLRYTADFNGTPYRDAVILYTAYNGSSLLAYGRATTDASGSFVINFTMPSDGATIELASQTPDGAFGGTILSEVACHRLNVQVGTLQVGTTGLIVATLPTTGGPWFMDIEFYPSNPSAPPDANGGWQVKGELTGIGVRLGAQTVAGGSVNLSVPLPSFLPAGAYYLSIVAYPLNAVAPAASTFPLRYAYAALVTVQGPPLNAALLVLVTLPIVLAVGVAAWVVERRRRRRPPPERMEPQAPPPAP